MDREQEHEVYGGDIPEEEGEMEADEDMATDDQDPQSSKEVILILHSLSLSKTLAFFQLVTGFMMRRCDRT